MKKNLKYIHMMEYNPPPFRLSPESRGKSRDSGEPPPIVLSSRSRRDLPSPPWKLMGSGAKFGGERDLGFVIDSAQLFSSNVCMREMWWHRTTAGRAHCYSAAYGDRSSPIPIREKITRGLQAISPPKCKKRALENKKEPLKIGIDCNWCKSLFNVAD